MALDQSKWISWRPSPRHDRSLSPVVQKKLATIRDPATPITPRTTCDASLHGQVKDRRDTVTDMERSLPFRHAARQIEERFSRSACAGHNEGSSVPEA